MEVRRSRLALAPLLGAVIVVWLGIAVIPMHISLGAGSLRCGTAWAPDTNSEIRRVNDLCREARAPHVRASLMAGVLLAVLALPAVAIARWPNPTRRLALAGWLLLWVLAAAAALAGLGWAVEHSPPPEHEVFEL